MSKERLEEIEKNLDPLGYGMGGHLISVNDIYWLVKYAREQAERADKNAQDLEDMDRQLYSEQQQNKRYKQALEEIIRQHELEDEIDDYDFMWNVKQIARQALEESK